MKLLAARPPDIDHDRRTLGSALATLAIHHADPDGICHGCLTLLAKLAWAPCPTARSAAAALSLSAS